MEKSTHTIDAGDFEGHRLLKAIDAFGQGHIVGESVVGFDGGGIGGRDKQFAALRFRIPGFAHVADQRPLHRIMAVGGGDDGDRAAFGLQADGRGAREPCHLIAPGAGGIDDDPCTE